MTIPDDYGNLYDLPEGVLNAYRRILSQDLDMYIEGPSKVSLFLYDNGTFIVESFRDEPVTIRLVTNKKIEAVKDMLEGSRVEKLPESQRDHANRYLITLMPHSYKVYEVAK